MLLAHVFKTSLGHQTNSKNVMIQVKNQNNPGIAKIIKRMLYHIIKLIWGRKLLSKWNIDKRCLAQKTLTYMLIISYIHIGTSTSQILVVTFIKIPCSNINWWYRKYHQWATWSSHARNDVCTAKREDLNESTGVVPAKYPPKVKLELSQL